MSYSEVLETRGDFRAVIHIDESPERPDGDYFGTIVWLDDRGHHTEAFAWPYGHKSAAEELAGQVNSLWRHWRDMALVERFLRIWEGVVGFDYFETADAKFVNVVTRADLEVWGWNPDDPTSWPYEDPARNNLDEARAWAEGDVWYRTVEKRVTWHTDDADYDDRDEWEEVPESSLHGYFGRKYAEESALEALESYAPEAAHNA